MLQTMMQAPPRAVPLAIAVFEPVTSIFCSPLNSVTGFKKSLNL
jgi:hypothetical protein